MSGFWSWYVIVITVGTIAASLWLFLATGSRRLDEGETTGHTWDGDLTEYNNPLPRWWLWLFYLTVAFGILYLALYPGLGNFTGTLGWSQTKQYDGEVATAEQAYGEILARFAGMSIPELAGNSEALSMGHNLFVNNCATCHGSDGRGAPGYPNLTDDNWQWGGDPDTIELTILNGRSGIMPSMAAALGEQGIEEVANYVLSLSGREADAALAEAGQVKFATCAACHGMDGRGNQALGAPDLTDDVWLYGDSLEDIRDGIVNGRNNQMPAQRDYLGEARVRVVAAYVYNLSSGAGAEGAP